MPNKITEEALAKAKKALQVSPSINRHQAIINLMQQAAITLPDELTPYVNDPQDYDDATKRFAKVEEHLPELIEHYKKEAIARDQLRIMRKLKIAATSELMQEIGGNIAKLYEGADDLTEYNRTINNLKAIMVRERLRHSLPEGTDITPYKEIIDKAFADNIPSAQLATNLAEKLKENSQTVPDKLGRMCSSFLSLQAINTPEKMQARMASNILDIMNENFRREIVALNDFQETTLTGTETLYRGIKLDKPEEFIESFFNNQHRMWDSQNQNDLFLFDVSQSWNKFHGKWEIGGTYMSFNHATASRFASKNGLLLEINPHRNKQVITGGWDIEYEVIANQVAPEEIRAIYIIKDDKVESVHENPNFDSPYPFKPLKLQIGDGVDHKRDIDELHSEGVYAYRAAKLNKNRHVYQDYDDFTRRYNKEGVIRNRERMLARKGFSSYQQKWEACKIDPITCKDFKEIYQELKLAVKNGDAAAITRITSNTKILSATDKEGNNLLMLAVQDKDLEMVDFAVANQIDINAQNLRGETALHLAAEHDALAILDKLARAPGVDLGIKDVAGREAIYDVVSEQAFKWFSDKVPSLLENNFSLADHYYNKKQYNLVTKLLPKLDIANQSHLFTNSVRDNQEEIFKQLFSSLQDHPEHMQKAFKSSVSCNREKMFATMLPYMQAHPKHMQDAFTSAVYNNKKEIFAAMLPHMQNHPKHMQAAFKSTVMESSMEIFAAMLPHMQAHPEFMKDAFATAVESNKKEIFAAMLPHMQNHPEHMINAFDSAVHTNNKEMFAAMLPSMQAHPALMDFTLSRAIFKGRNEMFAAMLPHMTKELLTQAKRNIVISAEQLTMITQEITRKEQLAPKSFWQRLRDAVITLDFLPNFPGAEASELTGIATKEKLGLNGKPAAAHSDPSLPTYHGVIPEKAAHITADVGKALLRSGVHAEKLDAPKVAQDAARATTLGRSAESETLTQLKPVDISHPIQSGGDIVNQAALGVVMYTIGKGMFGSAADFLSRNFGEAATVETRERASKNISEKLEAVEQLLKTLDIKIAKVYRQVKAKTDGQAELTYQTDDMIEQSMEAQIKKEERAKVKKMSDSQVDLEDAMIQLQANYDKYVKGNKEVKQKYLMTLEQEVEKLHASAEALGVSLDAYEKDSAILEAEGARTEKGQNEKLSEVSQTSAYSSKLEAQLHLHTPLRTRIAPTRTPPKPPAIGR